MATVRTAWDTRSDMAKDTIEGMDPKDWPARVLARMAKDGRCRECYVLNGHSVLCPTLEGTNGA